MWRITQVYVIACSPGGAPNLNLPCSRVHVYPPALFMPYVRRRSRLRIDPRLIEGSLYNRVGQQFGRRGRLFWGIGGTHSLVLEQHPLLSVRVRPLLFVSVLVAVLPLDLLPVHHLDRRWHNAHKAEPL